MFKTSKTSLERNLKSATWKSEPPVENSVSPRFAGTEVLKYIPPLVTVFLYLKMQVVQTPQEQSSA